MSMDISTWIYLAKYSLGKPGAIKNFRQALTNQNLTYDQLEDFAYSKTLKLLNHAYNNVPWYSERFNALGLHPGDIKNREDFKNIPVLQRSEINENFSKFISSNINVKSLKISTTGGSTGKPLKIGMDGRALREVQKWQMLSWWGLSPAMDMATVYRQVPVGDLKKAALNLIQWPKYTIRADASNMTEDSIAGFIEQWNKHKPNLLHGYTGAVYAIADYIIRNDIKLHSPKVIWLTASPVTRIVEDKVNSAFNAPVCDQYGCSEIYYISAECPHKQGLHIFADSVKVEVLDENNQPVKSGDYGKIVLTNLDELNFPLIRYENGDTGRLLDHHCSCGICLPLMDKVKGRVTDNLILPDGTILAGEYLTTIFDDYTDTIKQFQVVQHKNLNITIRYVRNSANENEEKIISRVNQDLQKRIKGLVVLNFISVEDITHYDGKLKYIVRE